MGCASNNEITLIKEKTVTSPYLTELVTLEEPFDLYIVQGASFSLADKNKSIEVTLNNMSIICVELEGDDIGNQFSFEFTAKLEEQYETFNLTLNEPQNMDLIELNIEKNEVQLFSDYTVTLINLNFAVGKNSVNLVVTK